MKVSRKIHYLDITNMVDEDGQLTFEQMDALGLVDVTYSEPEFTHDCEQSGGLTLGYYLAKDKSIWRSDFIESEDKVELCHVSMSEWKRLRTVYNESIE